MDYQVLAKLKEERCQYSSSGDNITYQVDCHIYRPP